MKLKDRFSPLLALLDARYFPLLFAAAPQAYTIYKWLYLGSDKSSEAWLFAVVGALGFEMVYIGAIAWAEGRAVSNWFWITALTALVFSVLVALKVYIPADDGWAFLHAGFPLVAFTYTMLIHRASSPRQPEAQEEPQERAQLSYSAQNLQISAPVEPVLKLAKAFKRGEYKVDEFSQELVKLLGSSNSAQ